MKGWTRRHSYFTVMGGFYEGQERLASLSSLDTNLYPELLKKEDPTDETSPQGAPLVEEPSPSKYQILVTESEILDKSKSDPLGKLITVLQTTWFIAQYLERWVAHQPRTQLEVVTIAYAALNILVYALWWDKPLNIQEVIDVGDRRSASVGRTEGIDTANTIIDASPFIVAAMAAVASVADSDVIPSWIKSLFRSISNCIAWLSDLHPVFEFAFDLIAVILLFLLFSSEILYVICRIILVVLTFTSLRAPPAGVFEATSWTSLIPHFG